MTLTTTLKLLREHHACQPRYDHLVAALGNGWQDDAPIPLERILDTNGLDDALWALRTLPDEQRRTINAAYDEQRRPIDAAYYEQRRPIDATYYEQRRTINAAYDEQRRPIDAAYDEQRRTIDAAYYEQRRTAFLAALRAYLRGEKE